MKDLLDYKGYYASVHFSSADDVFYGKLLGIDDLVNFEGTSVKELKKAVRNAVNDYLATCEAVGKEPNKTYKGTFNVRISMDLHREAAVYAASNNISLNDFVKRAVEFALGHKEELKREILDFN
jgi:predicted HicB family RNase H-like nuclease